MDQTVRGPIGGHVSTSKDAFKQSWYDMWQRLPWYLKYYVAQGVVVGGFFMFLDFKNSVEVAGVPFLQKFQATSLWGKVLMGMVHFPVLCGGGILTGLISSSLGIVWPLAGAYLIESYTKLQ